LTITHIVCIINTLCYISLTNDEVYPTFNKIDVPQQTAKSKLSQQDN